MVALFVLGATLPRAHERVHHSIDYLGTTLLAGGLAAIVLCASLGGTSFAWGSATIVGLGAGGVVLLGAFVLAERRAEEPVLPPHLFRNRIFSTTSAVGFIVGFALFGAVTYLPLFLQVVKGASPTGSGLQLVPLMGGLLVTSIASGQTITRTGHYKPFPIVGTAVMVLGLYLLSTMEATTSTTTSFAFMFVLGLGLGLVMQVLVLAVQNAVEYADLGVATSGATLFRSIGGSLGTSVLGAIFANRLSSELKRVLPAGAAPRGGGVGAVNPQQIDRLPPALRDGYLHAFTSSLSTVFLVAAAVALVAFALTWLIGERPLRETVASAGGDLADTYAALRASDSLAEIEAMIGRADQREGAREIIARIAARAGVELDPAACWLLARLSKPDRPSVEQLARAAGVAPERLLAAGRELRERGLIERVTPASAVPAQTGPKPSDYALSDAGRATLARLTKTGEQRLGELLEDWRPQEHAELARLIDRLAREFFVEDSALRAALPTTAAAQAR